MAQVGSGRVATMAVAYELVELGSGEEATMGMWGVDERSCHGSHLHWEQLERGDDSRFL